MEDRVIVTGMGAVSALGTGLAAHREALFAGRDGFRTVERFDTAQLPTHLAATWPGWDGRRQPEVDAERDLAATSREFQVHELGLVAAREALAGIAIADRRRAAIVFGTCFGQGFGDFSGVTRRIAAGLEFGGPQITISTACSSSTNAIGLGRDLLLRGHADIVIAGGGDALLREAFAGFSALGVLSGEPCAPFSDPPGTILGEGAAFVVLERASAAKRPALASIHGYGLSSDGFHETTPDPSGSGIARAIRGALLDAGWNARDVEFVSAHATGTTNNDRIEWAVIASELGGPPTSGAKGHLGHTQGAAGVLELVLALICHREKHVPPTLHFRGPRTGCPSDPMSGDKPRAMPVSRALKLSAAFGGANAVLAYGLGDVADGPRRARVPVAITGAGVIGPRGAFELSTAASLTKERSVGASAAFDLDEVGVDGRRLDRSARLLTAAAAIALKGDRNRERTGLFVAAARMPAESARRCTESIRQRGIAGTSAAAFARMSVNAPTGACSQALGLLGPSSTFSIGEGSGLLAVVLAAEHLAFREDAVHVVAGGVDERAGKDPDETEGAACITLSRGNGPVVVAEWTIAGPGEDVTKKLGAADAFLDGEAFWGTADAVRSCVAVAVAASRIARGDARSIAIVSNSGSSSVGIVLQRGDA